MDCPYCKKDIYGLTGLQEATKFQKHLKKCKKNPAINKSVSLLDAVAIRAESGQ